MMNATARVFWTQSESRLVAQKYIELIQARESKRSAIFKAQQLLPEERRRSDMGLHALIYDKANRNNDFWFYVNNPDQIAPPPDETPAVAVSGPARPESVGGATQNPIDPFGVFGQGMEAAASVLASTIAITLRTKLEEELNKQLSALESELTARLAEIGAFVATASADPEKCNHLPRVLVVSLLGHQGAEIRKEFEGLLRVQWVESGTHDRAVGKLRNFPGHVVIMNKFVSHSDEQHFKGHPHKHNVAGGLTELREFLLEVASNAEEHQ